MDEAWDLELTPACECEGGTLRGLTTGKGGTTTPFALVFEEVYGTVEGG